MGRADPFDREDISHLVGGYYRSASRRGRSKSRYHIDMLEANIRTRLSKPKTELPPLDRTPFSFVLEQAQVELGLSFIEYAQMIGVTERTLYTWMQGTIPSRGAFEKLLKRVLDRERVSKGTIDLLLSTYGKSTGIGFHSEKIEIVDGSVVDNSHNAFESILRADTPPPAIPKQTSPGPPLKPTSTGFDIAPQSSPEAEREDSELQRLHQQLRRLVDRLTASMPRISNTHKELADQFAAYAEFLAPDLNDLDITSFWAVGTGLGAHIRALNRAGPNVMTPELEPALMAQFETLMAVHAAFVLGFSAAREMQARIAQARAAAQDDPELPTRVQSVLTSMVKTPHLLADKARLLVDALVHGIPAAPEAAFDVLSGRYETARNGTHAFMRALHPIIEVAGAVGLLSFVHATVSGDQVDLMLTTGAYINAHMQELMALYRNDQITTDWLRWAHLRLQRRDK